MSEAGEQETGPSSGGRRMRDTVLAPTIALVVFVLGLMAGIPIAIFGLDVLVDNATTLFALLLAVFFFVVFLTALILAFRRPIWERLFRFGQVEVDRFARPLGDVARYAAEQKVSEATVAAQDLAEMVFSRYSWIVTRRWLVAAITAFIAAIAALAGAAILFQQNQLLRVQNERITEQTELLRRQIELGEAQRSTSIVPEILSIGEALGEQTTALEGVIGADTDLSPGLQTRIVAATNAARPYRYLRSHLANANELMINYDAVARRTDLPQMQAAVANWIGEADAIYGRQPAPGELTDRAVSPERGQILALLYGTRVLDIEHLNFAGADFSFTELRLPILANMRMRHGTYRYADFSSVALHTVDFSASFLEGARFRHSDLSMVTFSSLESNQVRAPYQPEEGMGRWNTALSGADFSGAVVVRSGFAGVNGMAMNFDGAVIDGVDFSGAVLSAGTFRSAILGRINFEDADLRSVDFDGALVFSKSFLDDVAQQAAEGSFVRERFEMAPVDRAMLDAHPKSGHVWRVVGWQGPVWRIERVRDFE